MNACRREPNRQHPNSDHPPDGCAELRSAHGGPRAGPPTHSCADGSSALEPGQPARSRADGSPALGPLPRLVPRASEGRKSQAAPRPCRRKVMQNAHPALTSTSSVYPHPRRRRRSSTASYRRRRRQRQSPPPRDARVRSGTGDNYGDPSHFPYRRPDQESQPKLHKSNDNSSLGSSRSTTRRTRPRRKCSHGGVASELRGCVL